MNNQVLYKRLLPGVMKTTEQNCSHFRVTLAYLRRHTAVGEGKSEASAFSKALKQLLKLILMPFVRKDEYGPGTNGAHRVALRNRFVYRHIRHDHYVDGYGDSAQKAEDDAWYNLLEVLSWKDILQLLRHGYDVTRRASDTLEPRCLFH